MRRARGTGCPGPGESARLLVPLSCSPPQGKAMAPSSQTGWVPSGPEFAATSLHSTNSRCSLSPEASLHGVSFTRRHGPTPSHLGRDLAAHLCPERASSPHFAGSRPPVLLLPLLSLPAGAFSVQRASIGEPMADADPSLLYLHSFMERSLLDLGLGSPSVSGGLPRSTCILDLGLQTLSASRSPNQARRPPAPRLAAASTSSISGNSPPKLFKPRI